MTTITVSRRLLEQARDYVHYVVDDRLNAEWIDREALERDLTTALAQQAEPQYGWVCPKCRTDRLTQPCPKGHTAALTGECPMVAKAHTALEKSNG